MTGCNHYGVEAKVDEQRLTLIKAGVKLAREYGATDAPRTRTSPGRAAPKSPQRPER